MVLVGSRNEGRFGDTGGKGCDLLDLKLAWHGAAGAETGPPLRIRVDDGHELEVTGVLRRPGPEHVVAALARPQP